MGSRPCGRAGAAAGGEHELAPARLLEKESRRRSAQRFYGTLLCPSMLENGLVGGRAQLFLHELQDLLKELEARLLEQHEMSGVRDQDALLLWRMHEISHEPFTIL